MRIFRHIAVVAAALFVCLGIPCLYFAHAGTLFADGVDVISTASLDVPDQPSGTFLVLLNRERHPETVEAWTAFFTEQDVDVIMEDISCLVSRGDAAGRELAERYQARLAENQMQLAQEDGTLVVSRAKHGLFDVIVVSAEAAAAYDYSELAPHAEVQMITVGDGA